MGGIFNNPARKERYIPKIVKHEESLQKQVCRFLRLQFPDVIFRSDFASGLHLSQHQARNQKSMQSSRAWPDLFIYHPVTHGDKRYCGLALELKKEGTIVILKTGPRKGHISSNAHIQEQAAVLKQLNNLGYYANFGVGFDDCVRIISWYLKRPVNSANNSQIF